MGPWAKGQGNEQAADKKGDERKTFMSECLQADKKS
jgi:hypothetical protein